MATIQSETDCYDIIEVLGKGTFGEVAKGWRRSTGEMVAIKILKNDAYRNRIIKNELKLLRCMRGLDPEEAHVIRFLEFFHDALKFYLVFELLEQNLFEFQKENNFAPLPARHIRTVTLQVLRALARLKELAIIHADLKPENIMLVDQTRCPFRVKVIDFGSASIFSEVRYVKEPYIQSRFYRAPEILLGLPFCEKVDVWSLGCVMAELHLGWPLYPGNNEYDQVRYICETQGLPKPHLLHAARKAHHFFKRNLHPDATNPWQLKSSADYLAETKVRPLERRKYMLKSLDQIETVNGSGAAGRLTFQDREALAEHADLKSMVELIKRMLTWESHERISPSAALRHPFVSMQQLRSAHETTRYYQLSLRSCRLSLQVEGKPPTPVVAASEEGPPYYRLAEEEEAVGLGSVAGSGPFFREEKAPGMQRAIDQLDDLSLQEAGHGLWGETPSALAPLKAAVAGLRVPDPGPEPILAFYGSRLVGRHKARKPPTGSKSDSNFSNLIRLSQASPEEEGPCRGSGWAEGEHRGASAKPPTIPKRDGDGPDVKDMTMDAERPSPELFDPSTCPGEWLSEPDWALEGIRGPRAQGLPHRHTHPHGPPRTTSFLQHVGGQH
ncbi:homeodomain-interacting protein kinase 4 [Myotis myotis]|uniref:non-specific serine/threonine protein kinase n=1 Tax=Myotis myotis TaxID=51298 RepID=A0A7J7SBM3_MYOMY|nr:homeodomain-interacting protein kinase 4 [Myotis myotis]KAF6285739.1 homeodomain interacting protein kinase 4 [Myotis myotis]